MKNSIHQQVHSRPNEIALEWVQDNNQISRMTYLQLWNHAAKLAAALKFPPAQSVIGVSICGGPALVIALLAIWQKGLIMIPIPNLRNTPVQQLKNRLASANCKHVLTITEDAYQYLPENINILYVSPDWYQAANLCDSPMVETSVNDNYLMSHIYFTSGTTGASKGVLVSNSAMTAFVKGKNQAHGIGPKSRVLIASWHTFDPSYGDIAATLCAGGVVCTSNPADRVFNEMAICINLLKISHICTTPAVWTVALHTGLSFESLQVVALGGERMSAGIVNACSNFVLLNTYGVTECCVYQSAKQITKIEDASLIGEPFPGTEFFLLDLNENILNETGPKISKGELIIVGEQVGEGYIDGDTLSERNKKAFGRTVQGRPMYRTGDVACRLADGSLELLGRVDRQVKIRGERIELDAIESTLCRCKELIRAAYVNVWEDRLVAWVILSEPAHQEIITPYSLNLKNTILHAPPLLQDTLKFICHEFLHSKAAIPSLIGVSASPNYKVPLASTGKVALSNLPSPTNWGEIQSFIRPLELFDTEEQIANCWTSLLPSDGRDHVWNPYIDSFIRLGGDSLSAILISNAIQRAFLVKWPEQVLPIPSAGEILEPFQTKYLMEHKNLASYASFLANSFSITPSSKLQCEEFTNDFTVIEDGTDLHDIEKEMSQNFADQLLLDAVHIEITSVIKTLIPYCSVKGKNSALLHCGTTGRSDICRFLIENGAKPTANNQLKQQILHIACVQEQASVGSIEIIRMLIEEYHVAPMIKTKSRQTLMHCCARSGRLDAINELVKHCSPEQLHLMLGSKDRWDRTALHWGILNGHKLVVERLLELGSSTKPHQRRVAAQKKITRQEQETPLQIAIRLYGKEGGEIGEILRRYDKNN